MLSCPDAVPAAHLAPLRYAYFNAAGEESKPCVIACDGCGAECVEQSWFVNEEDICPACYEKAGGVTGKYAGAEYQEDGEPCAQPAAKKKAKTEGGQPAPPS